jgi:hypothetical protein
MSRHHSDRRGFVREGGFLILMAFCAWVLYLVARGDAATMTEAFIRRVRAMGQPN